MALKSASQAPKLIHYLLDSTPYAFKNSISLGPSPSGAIAKVEAVVLTLIVSFASLKALERL
jgi:hypothetical protein